MAARVTPSPHSENWAASVQKWTWYPRVFMRTQPVGVECWCTCTYFFQNSCLEAVVLTNSNMLIHCKKHPGDHWSCQLVIYSGTQLELSGRASWPCSNSHLLVTMVFFFVFVQWCKYKCGSTGLYMHPWTSWYFFYCFFILCCSMRVHLWLFSQQCLKCVTGAAGWGQTHRSKLTWLLFRLTYTYGACFMDTSLCVKHSWIICGVEWGCPQAQGWDPKCSPSDGPALCSASFSILIALFPERDLVYLYFFCWCAISMSKQWHN